MTKKIVKRSCGIVLLFIVICVDNGWAQYLELKTLGVRGGINYKDAGLPPGEKEDFEQFEVFAVMGVLPWKYTSPSGWEVSGRLGGSAGALRGAGETGFISTLTGGPELRIPDWWLVLDAGVGGALLSDWKFGRQNIGGPFQFLAHAGVGVQLPWRMLVGWRFHHMSDGTLYGSSRGVDFHMLELGYTF